ncbi:MAG: hypothetical protein K0U84_22110 [Actinomycetia bacterium]|nr:hypothetical protein [Actinomycetes bacterium]
MAASCRSGTLSEDDRFVRASRRAWGLRSWEIPEYAGIAHAIGARIDAAGGTAKVTDVFEDLLAAYPDIAETSIKTYLSTLEFVVTAGMVRRRTDDDEWPEVAPLNTVRGAFRNGTTRYGYSFRSPRSCCGGPDKPFIQRWPPLWEWTLASAARSPTRTARSTCSGNSPRHQVSVSAPCAPTRWRSERPRRTR